MVKALEKDNHPGVKRVLNLTTISRGTIDIWDGTNVDDLRQLALDFAGTKLKVRKNFKRTKSFIMNCKTSELGTFQTDKV